MKSNPKAYSHTALLRDVERDEDGKIINKSAPYGSVDLSNDGQVIAVRHWNKDKKKESTPNAV